MCTWELAQVHRLGARTNCGCCWLWSLNNPHSQLNIHTEKQAQKDPPVLLHREWQVFGEKRPISALPGRAPGQGAFKKNQQQKEEVAHLSEGFILGSVLATLASVVVIKHQDQSHSKKRVGAYSSRGAKMSPSWQHGVQSRRLRP